MTRTTYGIIAGLVAAGLGAWWYRSRSAAQRFDPRGTVIFDNTPTASAADIQL